MYSVFETFFPYGKHRKCLITQRFAYNELQWAILHLCDIDVRILILIWVKRCLTRYIKAIQEEGFKYRMDTGRKSLLENIIDLIYLRYLYTVKFTLLL